MDRVFFYDESVSSKEELNSVELSRKFEIGLGMPCRDTNNLRSPLPLVLGGRHLPWSPNYRRFGTLASSKLFLHCLAKRTANPKFSLESSTPHHPSHSALPLQLHTTAWCSTRPIHDESPQTQVTRPWCRHTKFESQ